MLPIFQMIQSKGGVDEAELYQVFNMGIGMTVTVGAESVDDVLAAIRKEKHPAWLIGEVVKGTGICRVV